MNLREQREAALKAAREIAAKAQGEGRMLTGEEQAQVKEHLARADELAGKIELAEESEQLMTKAFAVPEGKQSPAATPTGLAGKLAEDPNYQLAKQRAAQRQGFSASTAEIFQAKDFSTGGPTGGLVQTQYGRVVPEVLRRPTVASLLASGTMTATTLTYYVQGPTTGDFAPTAELGSKPAIDFSFDSVVEHLTKIAGHTKISSEAFQDTPYLVSVIEGQLLQRLAIVEEDQILNGDGTGQNMTGILNRSGILTESASSGDDNLDAIFRGMTAVEMATQMSVDAVVIHPLDYQELRLSRDGNEQYYGGGPFTGAYGNSGLAMGPGVWGQRTVITSAIPQGTVLVGAFAAGGQLLRKGGVSVDMTNTDQDDFVKNRVTIRAESRILLAVYQPSAFCEVTLVPSGS